MSFPRDLLEQADHLANREPKRPKQASLRRAISSAYYALFHLLLRDAAFDAAQGLPLGLRELVQRTGGHTDMRNVCKGFVKANAAYAKSVSHGKAFETGEIPLSTQRLIAFPLEPDLTLVMNTFVELQAARYSADYDVTSVWNRMNVLDKVQTVHVAFHAWSAVRAQPNTTVFKSALLFQKNWGR
jgi:hypothetical protein